MSFKKKNKPIVFIEIARQHLLPIRSRILDRICITKNLYKQSNNTLYVQNNSNSFPVCIVWV
jgi:hypothetical protein